MTPFDRLRKLHLIADQDHVFGTYAHCDRVGERNLTRLVYEEVIELLIEFLSPE